MIPQETIERIRESADIVAIIGETVKLRRVGSDFRGPFSAEQVQLIATRSITSTTLFI